MCLHFSDDDSDVDGDDGNESDDDAEEAGSVSEAGARAENPLLVSLESKQLKAQRNADRWFSKVRVNTCVAFELCVLGYLMYQTCT